MRVDPEFYKGIEYIRISSLPEDQKEKITLTISQDKVIKIQMEGKLLSDCIQYVDYLIWFEAHHQSPLIVKSQERQPHGLLDFTLNKN